MKIKYVEAIHGDGTIKLKYGYTTLEIVLIGITIIISLIYIIYLLINLPTILRILF